MRFLMLIYPDIPQASDEWMPSADTPRATMGRYNKELSEAGVLLALDGLLAPDRGARIHFNGPVPTVQDGPFTEAKEIVGVRTPSTNCWMSPALAPDMVGRVPGFKLEERPRIAKVQPKGI